MKAPTAKKLKSGSWRCQIQVHGKRYSCTGRTKKEAQDAAKYLFAGIEKEERIALTVGKAIDNYISSKEKVLSPSTIVAYKKIRRNDLQSLMDVNISDLDQIQIQIAVSEDMAKGKSPKSIKNAHGLLTAVLKQYRPQFIVMTRLPQNAPAMIKIPSEEEMKLIWAQAKGTPYELPILMASWLGLRMSEIRGLKYGDFEDGKLHVQRAMVKGPTGYIVKGTKTISGNRIIVLPELIDKMVKDKRAARVEIVRADRLTGSKKYIVVDDEYLFNFKSNALYKGFVAICKKAGVEHFRFHDLRHFAASEAHALGIPDKYAMKRMGHATDNMLRTVYQHTIADKEDIFAKTIDTHMEELYSELK